MSIPIIAIVGRPNVGKSTLFNRIAGRRIAIVSDIPGTTRDRVSIDTVWNDKKFILVDTAGVENQPHDQLMWDQIRSQVELAIEQSDLIIFTVDSSQDITDSDREISQMLRKINKPIIIAANKVDTPEKSDYIHNFYSLGFDNLLPISAYHNLGIDDLINESFNYLDHTNDDNKKNDSIRVAISGRPNVGKSALFNSIIDSKRSIVSEVAGTTRDMIDYELIYNEKKLTFLDTAGLRKRGKIENGIEKYSSLRTIRAIEMSHISLIVLDASELITSQDSHIIGYIKDANRATIIIVNKWDLAPKLQLKKDEVKNLIIEKLNFIPNTPILFTSAINNSGVSKIFDSIFEVYSEFNKRIPSSEINKIIFEAMGKNPLPGFGRKRPRIYRCIQKKVAPPSFDIITKNPELIHFSYRRYLENIIRNRYGFIGSPIKLSFMNRKYE
ncbi:MAG: ribosome biogenesis GTPase Der [Dehalococcoidia bacterium]|nr:ribosome biogenesis GTPase Der [Dehalococcoidia bacterium]MQG09717.1 ribosome biogenesis GTPase Der [SAR202 cluster bacterium]|tara:strand:+ start:5962 stop:7284 length:1323 start_codon:yes stop_codon:yes gene_type:complete